MLRFFASAVLAFCLLAVLCPANAEDTQIAAGKFLIASSYWMRDPLFRSCVILLLHHDPKKGTLGVILNHPTKMTVHEAVPDVKTPVHRTSPVYLGGPVSPKQLTLLVRTSKRSDELVYVMESVSFTANSDALREWLSGETRRNRVRLFAGYSGWGVGQLEAEMKIGGWRLLPADAGTVFDMDPAKLWPELSNRKPPLQTIHRDCPAPLAFTQGLQRRKDQMPAPLMRSTSR